MNRNLAGWIFLAAGFFFALVAWWAWREEEPDELAVPWFA